MKIKKTFRITGMHCESCARIIEMELSDKVQKINVNHKTGSAEIEFDETLISPKEIASIITKQGYKTNLK